MIRKTGKQSHDCIIGGYINSGGKLDIALFFFFFFYKSDSFIGCEQEGDGDEEQEVGYNEENDNNYASVVRNTSGVKVNELNVSLEQNQYQLCFPYIDHLSTELLKLSLSNLGMFWN